MRNRHSISPSKEEFGEKNGAQDDAYLKRALHPDARLEPKVDELIAKIAAAQQKDGYLDTYIQLNLPDLKWTSLAFNHELFCAGSLFEAAVAHNRATGKRSLLDVALRLADHLDSTFGPDKQAGINRETSFAVRPGTYLIREVVQDSEEGHLAALNSIVEIPF
ncbi:MAG: beta-L-arabinofuranosidase domain-containing protein [Terriglobia bacterium]